MEYCTNKALEEAFGEGNYFKFDTIAFFAAKFTSRRLRLSAKRGYKRNLPYANQTGKGQAFIKLPREVYQQWHRHVCGFLPIDRELWNGSLIGARDREYAVCRLKPAFLRNSRAAREPPLIFVCDEQLNPYFGNRSGAKKRKPKKKSRVWIILA